MFNLCTRCWLNRSFLIPPSGSLRSLKSLEYDWEDYVRRSDAFTGPGTCRHQYGSFSYRECCISHGSKSASRGRNRTAPPHRARGIPAARATRRWEVPNDFEVVSETGPIRFSSLFGNKDTLMVYSMMYGPERKAPCPMCTSFLSSWNGVAVNLRERAAIAVTARSPIERLAEYKRHRGFAFAWKRWRKVVRAQTICSMCRRPRQ